MVDAGFRVSHHSPMMMPPESATDLSLPPPGGETPAEQKRSLRRELRQRRRVLSDLQQQQAARRIVRRMMCNEGWLWTSSMAAYWPADGELDPRPLLMRAQQQGKATYLPVLRPGQRLVFCRWQAGDTLIPNGYGIPEPRYGRPRPAWSLGMILLPLVGFDRSGGRLGMGGGFYDRTLAQIIGAAPRRPLLVGLAHACQEVPEIPLESWDCPVDAVLTDREWISVRECSDQQ